ncbi:MAG: polysaccharide biosynthesis protein [Ostreibacterium sp.]
MLIERLLSVSRGLKKLIFITHDVALLLAAFWLAFGSRLNFYWEWQLNQNWLLIGVTATISIFVFMRLGLYRAVIRFAGTKILNVVFIGSVISVFVLMVTAYYLRIPLPRSIPIMYFLLVLVLLTGSRFTIKGLLRNDKRERSQPVIIYGAGDSGRQLMEALKQVDSYRPVAFVDDNPKLHKNIIHNVTVYPPAQLPRLIEYHSADTILLAIPSAEQQQRREILTRLEYLPCKVLSMPGLKDLVEGKISVSALKKVSVIELLGRDAIEPVSVLMEKNIAGKMVMVTGAGGSIGAELCRQIVRQCPDTLILFELSEFSLYSIEQELSNYVHDKGLSIQIIPALGSVQHQRRLAALMKQYQVQTVYHAAAYKHVPLVEYNTIEGVRNNVFGTLHCAQAAIEAKVETFVLISTDKAVRPTNTMGATKRMSELVLQALAENTDHQTCFSMVRFGNVLGSSGSVIPLFERQISQGGPITVTHSEITRYFMTIPEAAQLVIQAGAMGEGGDVFVLDMGEPVRIIELAQKMVRLSGLTIRDEHNQNGDIEITTTGLRPGEKLYEELLIGENAAGTNHPRIMTTKEVKLPWQELQALLLQLESDCRAFEPARIRQLLISAPTGFQPSDVVCDILCNESSRSSSHK